jgi:hypothetical protein
MLQGQLCVPADAIRALCHVRHCYGNQLLSLRGECPIGKYALTERLEGLGSFGSQVLALVCEFLGSRLVDLFLFGHDLIFLAQLILESAFSFLAPKTAAL